MLYLLAIILPPIAVLFIGRPFMAILNLILTLCFWVPGAIHAIFLVHSAKSDKRQKELIEALKNKN
ncbi:YqaE/Pmp3 family membrane protein [Catenovulum sp. 2E275]|uniref:YqaE/Pmp3 family membrane protein n=1 Tax=Catenovulum sp. 2E275 TaxID=2980497 RepID=UPI0021D1EA7E|nr:YqaE/Pmp3 family membrane protein [Catenovulum sp. 2E275]MCU4675528.1 YqaE/Pmp3 family membrane protein [Catenovulum sp. 2E275]